MQVLSNEEIMVINQTAEFDSAIGYARKIEAAVLERFEIAGFEPAEPYDETRKGAPLYRLRETE